MARGGNESHYYAGKMRETEIDRSGRNSLGSRGGLVEAEKVRLQGINQMKSETIGNIKGEKRKDTPNRPEHDGKMKGRDMGNGICSSEQRRLENAPGELMGGGFPLIQNAFSCMPSLVLLSISVLYSFRIKTCLRCTETQYSLFAKD